MLSYELEKKKLILRILGWGFSLSESHSTGRINQRRRYWTPSSTNSYIPPPRYDSGPHSPPVYPLRSLEFVPFNYLWTLLSPTEPHSLKSPPARTALCQRHPPPALPLRRSTGGLVGWLGVLEIWEWDVLFLWWWWGGSDFLIYIIHKINTFSNFLTALHASEWNYDSAQPNPLHTDCLAKWRRNGKIRFIDYIRPTYFRRKGERGKKLYSSWSGVFS